VLATVLEDDSDPCLHRIWEVVTNSENDTKVLDIQGTVALTWL